MLFSSIALSTDSAYSQSDIQKLAQNQQKVKIPEFSDESAVKSTRSSSRDQMSIDEYNKYRDKEVNKKIDSQLNKISDNVGKNLRGVDENLYKKVKNQTNNIDKKIPLIIDLDDDNKKGSPKRKPVKVNKNSSLYSKNNVVMSPKEYEENQRLKIHRKQMNSKRDRANFNRFWKNAHRGDAKAQLKIGKMFLKGSGVAADTAKGQKWIEKSAQGGYVKAQTELGDMYSKRKFYKNSLYWYDQAAKQNDGKALFRLGEIYSNGEGVKIDVPKSIEYFLKSADLNNTKAQTILFYRYSMGDGVMQDPVEAYKWGMIAVNNRVKNLNTIVTNYGLSLSNQQRREALKRYGTWRNERHNGKAKKSSK